MPDKHRPTAEEEYSLFSEYKRTGDKKIRDRIVDSYLYIAKILSKKFINRGIDYDDIFQVASLGILYAAERFDPDRGVRFATYATPTVLGEIRKYFRDKGNFIRVPRRLYEIFYKAEKIARSTDGERLSIPELSRALQIPEETIRRAYSTEDTAFIESLEYEAYADGNMTLSNILGKEDSHFMMIEEKDFIEYCMSKLCDKEIDFIKKRYYEEKTQSEIAADWNVSQMYISRLERKILKRLKAMYFRNGEY